VINVNGKNGKLEGFWTNVIAPYIASGKRGRKGIKMHALTPDMVLPYFRHAITV